MENIAIIADDLTGASDTGIQFRKHGLKTKVVVNYSKMEQFLNSDEILAINSNTRPLGKEKAYKRIFDISYKLKKAGYNRIYKKIDSTLRGNPGRELEAVMDAFDSKLAIIAPSFPENGRCMLNGYLKVTSITRKNNMENIISADEAQKLCHVPTTIQATMTRKVANIKLKTVREGVKAILHNVNELCDKGNQVLTMDAVTKDDLNNIALACKFLPKNTILVGAAGFAAFLPKIMDLSSNKIEKPASKDGVILVVAGTCNPTTRTQIDNVLKNINVNLIKIDTNKIISGRAHEEVLNIKQKIQQHTEAADKTTNIFIIAVDTLFNPTKLNDNSKWGKVIASAMGKIVGMLVENKIIQSLVITGGDTALHVLNAIEAKGIDLEEEVLAGIPLGLVFGGKAHTLPIVTKAGGFGSPVALLEIIDHLQKAKKPNKYILL